MKCRNDSIGLWKILCTYMIVILHYGDAIGWKLAVEFFFIVSGLLLACDYDIKGMGYLQYIQNRILRLWPHYIFSFVVFILISTIISRGGYNSVVTELRYSFLEIFMLQILGIGDYATNHGAVWYVSALMVSSILLYGGLKLIGKDRRKRNLFCIICMIGGWCSQFVFGQMCIVTYDSEMGLCLMPGLIRGISEMAVGVECYYIGKWMMNRGIFEKYGKALITIEIFVMVMVTAYTRMNLKNYVSIILAYACVIIISFFAKHNWMFRYFNKWERYTYAIYLNHPIILILLDGRSLWMVLAIVTGYSIITTKMIEKFMEARKAKI